MRIKYFIHNGFVNCSITNEIDIDDEELEDLSEVEQNNLIDEIVKEEVEQRIEWGWSEVK